MYCPLFITLTMFRDGRKVMVNSSLIEEMTEYISDKEDEDYLPDQEGGTLVFIKGRPAIRVKEPMSEIRSISEVVARNFVISTVQTLHNRGYIK